MDKGTILGILAGSGLILPAIMSGSSGLGAFINLQGVLIVVGGTLAAIAISFPSKDNIPINSTRYQSNWELSAGRATGIARTLVSMGHDPDEVQVIAFGEYRPIDTNDTAEGRARNRRVELFFSKQNVDAALAKENATDSQANRFD